MRLKIEIQMDNAAFEENAGGQCALILKGLAARLQDACLDEEYHHGLYDENGNKVGALKVTR